MEINLDLIEQAQGEIKKLEQLKQLVGPQATIQVPFEVGKTYFVRTVTYHILIEVKQVIGKFIEGRCSWVADSGRFSDFINKGVISSGAEIEPITPPSGINTDCIVDYFVWTHKFLEEQK